MLPRLEELNLDRMADCGHKQLLLVAEGFEPRSLSFATHCKDSKISFEKAIVFDNRPIRKSRKEELIELLKLVTNEISEFEFHRYSPALYENDLFEMLRRDVSEIDEIIIDISVMSKLLIVSLIYMLKPYPATLTIVYTEPKDYAPSKEKYDQISDASADMGFLPSLGVHDVVRTPLLTSSVMQDKPSVIVCFTSFNERLIRSILTDLNPVKLLLVLAMPPRISWHAEATQKFNIDIVNEYSNDNPLSQEDNLLIRRASTLDYHESFMILNEIYREYCYTNRIIVAPTGSKMQAVSTGLIKACCPDIHVEYPTPESFLVDGFSTSEIHRIHQVVINNYSMTLNAIGEHYKLNG